MIDDDEPSFEAETTRLRHLPDVAYNTPCPRRRAANTTMAERSTIQTLHNVAGWNAVAIAQHMGLTLAQVRYALIINMPYRRRGRPLSVPHDIVNLLATIINTPRKTKRLLTYTALREVSPALAAYSSRALRNAMYDAGFRRVIQPTGLPLSPKTRQARLEFALRWSHLLPSDWATWIWSDETWVNGLCSGRRWVTIGPGEDAQEFAAARFKPHGWMFWACFAGTTKGPSLIWEKKWGKINSASYQQRVLPLLQAFWQTTPSYTIQQDNAPAHASKSTKAYMAEHFCGAHVAIWPPHSPDLNPIEHVWAWMKAWIERQYPVRPTGKNLQEAAKLAWEAVPSDMLKRLVMSMPRRIKAVIEANGGYTGM